MPQIRVVEIDENTRVPLRIVWVVGGALGGGVVWLTVMFVYLSFARTEIAEAKTEIKEIQLDRTLRRDAIMTYLHKLDKDITAIKAKLHIPEEG